MDTPRRSPPPDYETLELVCVLFEKAGKQGTYYKGDSCDGFRYFVFKNRGNGAPFRLSRCKIKPTIPTPVIIPDEEERYR